MGDLLEGCNTSGKIRALMASRDLNQGDLAKLLELSPATIVNRLDDNRWSVKELEKIAAEYGVNKADLI